MSIDGPQLILTQLCLIRAAPARALSTVAKPAIQRNDNDDDDSARSDRDVLDRPTRRGLRWWGRNRHRRKRHYAERPPFGVSHVVQFVRRFDGGGTSDESQRHDSRAVRTSGWVGECDLRGIDGAPQLNG